MEQFLGEGDWVNSVKLDMEHFLGAGEVSYRKIITVDIL